MSSRRAFVVAAVGALLCAGMLGAHLAVRRARAATHAASRSSARPEPRDPRAWPAPEALLTPIAASRSSSRRRVFIDAGHGAPQNTGNTSCWCVAEQDFTLRAGQALSRALGASGGFDTRVSRDAGEAVEYRDRVQAAIAWKADVFISLHSDVRGRVERWSPEPSKDCPVSWSAPGFAVLYSDEGDTHLVGIRSALAHALAGRMREAGFGAYDGVTYEGLYRADEAPGVYLDRHVESQRIFVLRATPMPAVLVETHHALDPREVARWEEPATLDAFATAVAAAVGDALGDGPEPRARVTR